MISDRSVLLIKGCDPARPEAGTWWLTPGGGIDEGESLEVAAVREVLEETGLHLDAEVMGPVIATRVAEFSFEGKDYRQTEWFFAVRVREFAPRVDGWQADEQRALLEHRWWSVDELGSADEAIYPIELATLFAAVLDDRITEPVLLSGT